jgi:hypothetical protein
LRVERSLPRFTGAALCAALFCVLLPGSARAQGVVLSAEGQPLPIRRVRALLVFQERGMIGLQTNEPNRQSLLIELELQEPAPRGALWILTCPPEDGAAQGGRESVLDELSGYWRGSTRLPEKDPWPAKKKSVPRLQFAEHKDFAALKTMLASRKMTPPAELLELLGSRRTAEWRFFSAQLRVGVLRAGPAHLRHQPLAASYPGAIGAARQTGERWWLPPTELMVLHSHFINVNDNMWGLEEGVGLRKRYQDPGTLEKGKPLWSVPVITRAGQKLEPGVMTVKDMPATEKFVKLLGPLEALFLTVVEGRPSRTDRAGLDFPVYSHYPSAVDPTGLWTGFITLGICLLGVVLLARVMLKKKGFLE